MAGPIQRVLYRRPVRNAVRALLGMQPRYGSGYGDVTRQAPGGSNYPGGQPTRPSVPPSPPVSGPSVTSSAALPAPVAAAPAVQPSPSADAPAPAKQPSGMMVGPRGMAMTNPFSLITSSSGSTPPRPVTPTPATIALTPQVDPQSQAVREAREQDEARRVLKRKQAEGLAAPGGAMSAAVTAQPVSQPPAQAGLSSLQPAAQPSYAQQMLARAEAFRSEAGKQRANAQSLLQQFQQSKDVDQRASLQLMYEAAATESARLDGAAESAEMQAQAERQADRLLDFQREDLAAKHPADTLLTNAKQLRDTVRQYGASGAVAAGMAQFRSSEAGAAADSNMLAEHELRLRQMVTPMALADRIQQRAAPRSAKDPLVIDLATYASKVAPYDASKRKDAIIGIVGTAMLMLNQNDPTRSAAMAEEFSKLVESNLRGY